MPVFRRPRPPGSIWHSRGPSGGPERLVFDGKRYHAFFTSITFALNPERIYWRYAVSEDLTYWTDEGTAPFPPAALIFARLLPVWH